jgi:hypothetical protein
MSITRSLGILIALGVPVIVGSGLVWSFTSSWIAIYVFLIILAFTALGFIDTSRM